MRKSLKIIKKLLIYIQKSFTIVKRFFIIITRFFRRFHFPHLRLSFRPHLFFRFRRAAIVGLIISAILFSLGIFRPKKLAQIAPKTPTAMAEYQFTPTAGNLVTGTAQAINSGAAAAAEGVNTGSWKGTLADDNMHWVIASTTSGYDVNLVVGGVQLNGANTLMLQTEFDLDATAPTTYVQICDWVSSTGVDNIADAQCTDGGWRTLNVKGLGITSTSATAYHYQIYDGYWSDGATAFSTPMTNFVNESNQIKVRYFSLTNTTSQVSIDYLRVNAIVNPVYSPAGLNNYNIAKGVVTSATSKVAYGLARDSTFMYIAGYEGSADWHIEKRFLGTGGFDYNFGTSGIITSAATSNLPYAIAIDSVFMYVVGDDSTAHLRVEKRRLSDGTVDNGFGTSGVLTGAVTPYYFGGKCIAIDSTYMYIVGNYGSDWRIEKRRLSDGTVDNGFGTNGVITSASASEAPYGIAIAGSYMYVAGYEGTNPNFDWRIEKRALSDGTVDGDFGTNGVITSDATSNTAYAIAIDATFMYVAGSTKNSPPYNWRIEKRALSDGAVDNGFGTSGVITSASACINSCYPRAIAIDATYMYVSGNDGSNGRIEKRALSDGSVDNGFGTSGVVTGAAASTVDWSIIVDSTYIYVGGINSSNTMRIEKRKISDGTISNDFGVNGVTTSASASSGPYGIAKDSTYMYIVGYDWNTDWRIEKRRLSDGMVDAGFGTNGVVTGASASQYARAIAIDTTYMYVAGTDGSDWRIEKRALSDGTVDNGFGTSGVITSDVTSDTARAIAISGSYMYVFGTDSTNHFRIEKRLLSDGTVDNGFGTSGVITGAVSPANAYDIAISGSYMYVVGNDSTPSWRIEKRALSDGAVDNGFGTNGVITSGNGVAQGITVDATYIYVVGYDSTPDWRIEKRALSDGAVDNGFGTNGVITGDGASNAAEKIAIYATYMYVVGTDGSDWRIEKRALSDGTVDNGFGTSGVITSASTSYWASAIVVDTTYMYVTGTDGTPDWRTEKRKLSDGSVNTDPTGNDGFGLAMGGYSYTTLGVDGVTVRSSDNIYNGAAGNASSIADFSYSFKNIKTYTGMNTIMVRAETSCDVVGINYRPKIYKFSNSTWYDLTSSDIACSATDATNIWALNNATLADYMSAGEIRVGFYGQANGTQTIRVDYIYIMLGTTNTDTGVCEISFGTNSANDCANTRDIDTSGTTNTWSIATENESGAMADDFYPYDTASNATTEEAASSHVKFSVTQPANSVLTGAFYASRMMSGVGGTVQTSLADYSSFNQATGGFTDVGTTSTTAETFTDNIAYSTTAGVGNYGLSGAINNPFAYINNTSNQMWLRLRTSTPGAIANNSVNQWDFAMVSLQWIEEDNHPSHQYQYNPTGGNKVTAGADPAITSIVAASNEGVNTGSWKGALADDNFHWGITSTAGGYDVNLEVGNVPTNLNGANTLMIETEYDLDATVPTTVVQICDWVNNASVDVQPDAQCTTGGWRTLNIRKVGVVQATYGVYHFQIYNGYWSDGSNTAINTPLANFISANKIKIRYYSATNTTSVVNIDYLRIYTVINPIYAPAGITNLGSGALSGDYTNAIIGATYTTSWTQAAADVTYSGAAGTAGTVADFYWSFKNVVSYPGANTIEVRALVSCSAIGVNYRPKIWNFAYDGGAGRWEDLTTGSIYCYATDNTHSWAKSNITITDYVSSGEIRVGFYGLNNGTPIIRADYIHLLLGTTNTDTDNCEISFGTNSAGDCSRTADLDSTGNPNTWKIDKETESTNFGHDFYALDNDADANLGAAAAAEIKYSAGVPVGSAASGIFFAFGTLAGASYNALDTGTVQGNIYDYSGYTGVTGGFTGIGSSPTTTLAYSDNISTGGISNGGTPGIITNPEDYVDTLNNQIEFRIRHTLSGGIGVNTPMEIDFAMASLQWINTFDASAAMTLSGSCKQYDHTANCPNSEVVKVAYNNNIQGQTGTTLNGAFTISGLTAPTAGDIITVFIDSVDNNHEANAVTKYDGSGNISGILLYEEHLTIGSDDKQTLANDNLSIYDNSATNNEDIFFDVDGNNDLTVDATSQSSQEKLYIKANNTYRPDSNSSGNVSTYSLQNAGTITADGNAFTLYGSWANTGTFTANASSVTFRGTDAATVTGTTSFYDLILNTTTDGAKTINFVANTTQTVTHAITLDGDNGKVLTLNRSGGSGSDLWTLTLPDNYTSGDYIHVTNSDVTSPYKITPGANVTDGGNNPGWLFNHTPDTPDPLAQKKTDDTVIATGGWTNETSIKFTGYINDTDTDDQVKLQVEIQSINTAFTGTPSGTSTSYCSDPCTNDLTVTGLDVNTEFHWQARSIDDSSATSSWVSYGGNSDGSPPGTPAARDVGIDTSKPLDGTVNDSAGADQDWNDGTLNALTANWTDINSDVSGLQFYEYAVRRQSDGDYWNSADGGSWQGGQVWYGNGTNTSATVSSINLQTSVVYYFSIRTTDNANNTSDPISSDGLQVSPSLSFSIDRPDVTFVNLNANNDWTNTQTSLLKTSTNAASGYVIQASENQPMTSLAYPTKSISDFAGLWILPLIWNAGTYGFGYTSSDVLVQYSNRFDSGNKFAAFSLNPPGDIVADHTDVINGVSGPVVEEPSTITYKVATTDTQVASYYRTYVTYIVTATY